MRTNKPLLLAGELIDSSCELQVDGPDAVDLAWFMNDEKLEVGN